MIQTESTLEVADNSGARKVACIRVLGGTRRTLRLDRRHHRRVGEGRDPERAGEEGRGAKAVIVRTAQGRSARADGSYIRFDDNAAVLVDNQTASRSARASSGRSRASCAPRKFMKIISLAPEVL